MEYKRELDYCTYSPDQLFGVRFNYACFLHDRQYRNEVENRKTRNKADKDFRKHIIKIFINQNKRLRGYLVAWIYYIAVRLHSGKWWVNG